MLAGTAAITTPLTNSGDPDKVAADAATSSSPLEYNKKVESLLSAPTIKVDSSWPPEEDEYLQLYTHNPPRPEPICDVIKLETVAKKFEIKKVFEVLKERIIENYLQDNGSAVCEQHDIKKGDDEVGELKLSSDQNSDGFYLTVEAIKQIGTDSSSENGKNSLIEDISANVFENNLDKLDNSIETSVMKMPETSFSADKKQSVVRPSSSLGHEQQTVDLIENFNLWTPLESVCFQDGNSRVNLRRQSNVDIPEQCCEQEFWENYSTDEEPQAENSAQTTTESNCRESRTLTEPQHSFLKKPQTTLELEEVHYNNEMLNIECNSTSVRLGFRSERNYYPNISTTKRGNKIEKSFNNVVLSNVSSDTDNSSGSTEKKWRSRRKESHKGHKMTKKSHYSQKGSSRILSFGFTEVRTVETLIVWSSSSSFGLSLNSWQGELERHRYPDAHYLVLPLPCLS